MDAREIVRDISKFNDRLSLREYIRSLDYFRCIEYPLVMNALEVQLGVSLLDLGAGRGPFALYLASIKKTQVTSLDIDPGAIEWQRKNAERLKLTKENFAPMVGDSRKLPFGDCSFDRVLNLGSVEHIRDDGDSKTASEMGRILKPGGLAVFSIPYSSHYEENEASSHVGYFERRYDDPALEERLIRPSGLKERARLYFGEPGRKWGRFWYSVPFIVKIPFRRLTPWMASRWLAVMPPARRSEASGICLVLEKSKP